MNKQQINIGDTVETITTVTTTAGDLSPGLRGVVTHEHNGRYDVEVAMMGFRAIITTKKEHVRLA